MPELANYFAAPLVGKHTLETGPVDSDILLAMPSPEQRDYYQRRSADVHAMAKRARDPEIRATLQGMAASYDKLVEEADRIADLRLQLPLI